MGVSYSTVIGALEDAIGELEVAREAHEDPPPDPHCTYSESGQYTLRCVRCGTVVRVQHFWPAIIHLTPKRTVKLCRECSWRLQTWLTEG